MNQQIALTDILSTALFAASLWYLLCYCIKESQAEDFRQQIFNLRDNLFDDALNGMIAFDHPAYGLLRETMNGYLRFGHKLSFASLFLVYLMPSTRAISRRPQFSFEKKWKEKANDLTGEQKEKLSSYKRMMNRAVLCYLWKTSPTLIATTIVFIVPIVLVVAVGSLLKAQVCNLFAIPMSRLNSAAMTYGKA